MNDNRIPQKIAQYLLPSIPQMVFLIVFIACFSVSGSLLLDDGDTGYHIRAGEIILRDIAVPRQDPFSFITPALPWTAHEWLSEVVMALVHDAVGMPGIVFFFALLLATIYWMLSRWIRSRGGNFFLDLAVLILVVLSSRTHWHARPHIFSLFLFLILYRILVHHQEGRGNRLYVIPLLMVPWVNLHGGYILGFAIMGIFLAGYFAGFMASQGEERKHFAGKGKQLGLICAASMLAACINPFGFHAFLFPFRLVFDTYLMDHVQEFLSPNFHEGMPYRYLLLLLIAVLGLSRARMNFTELALVLLMTSMSLYSVRYIPLCAIVYAPILSRHGDVLIRQYDGWFSGWLRKRSEIYGSIDSSAKGYILPLVVLLIFAMLSTGKVQVGFQKKAMPRAAIDFLRVNPIPGNMFNNDEIGDFIIYSLYPRYKVFIDGRSDMYGPSILKEYSKVLGIEPGWKEVLTKYDINFVFVYTDSVLVRHLSTDIGWKTIYSDNVATIFLRNLPKNEGIPREHAPAGTVPPKGI